MTATKASAKVGKQKAKDHGGVPPSSFQKKIYIYIFFLKQNIKGVKL